MYIVTNKAFSTCSDFLYPLQNFEAPFSLSSKTFFISLLSSLLLFLLQQHRTMNTKLYLFSMTCFTVVSYYAMAKLYNAELKYDPNQLVKEHTGVDVDALFVANVKQMSAQVKDHWVRHVGSHELKSLLSEKMK